MAHFNYLIQPVIGGLLWTREILQMHAHDWAITPGLGRRQQNARVGMEACLRVFISGSSPGCQLITPAGPLGDTKKQVTVTLRALST